MTRLLLAAMIAALASGRPAGAQTATGTISGHVVDAQNLSIPGVTVTVVSPNLQGSRTAVTSSNGDYILPLLPPGPYTITFELSGFGKVTERHDVAATQPVSVDVTMSPASVTESVTVTGTPQLVLNSGATVNYSSGSATSTIRSCVASISPAIKRRN